MESASTLWLFVAKICKFFLNFKIKGISFEMSFCVILKRADPYIAKTLLRRVSLILLVYHDATLRSYGFKKELLAYLKVRNYALFNSSLKLKTSPNSVSRNA